MSLKKELIKGSTLLISQQVVVAIFGLLSNILLAKYFGAESYGKFLFLNSLIVILTIFTYNFEDSFIRFIPEYIKEDNFKSINLLLNATLIAKSILIFILILIVFISFDYFESLSVYSYYIYEFSFFLIPLVLREIILNYYYSVQEYKNIAIFWISYYIIYLSIILITMYLNYDLKSFITIFLMFNFSYMLYFIVFQIYIKNKYVFNLYNFPNLNEIIKFTAPLYGSKVMFIFNQNIGILLIGTFANSTFAALYGLPKKIIDQLTSLYYKIPNVLVPSFIKRYVGIQWLEKKIYTLFYLVSLASLILYFIIYSYSKEIILLFGDETFLDAVVILQILALQFLFRLPSNILNQIFIIEKKTKSIFWINIFKFIVDISTLYILMKINPLEGVAYSNIIGYAFAFGISLYYLKKEFNEIKILQPITVFLIMVIISLYKI